MNHSDSSLLVQLADEIADCYRRGLRPSLDAYVARHPHLEKALRELFPALLAMERFGSVAGPTTGAHAERPPAKVSLPERLGEYRILREVARGGMGIVYEAVQESLGRHVALKILPAAGSATNLERFRREARAAARLHHTNIVPVFGVGEDQGVHYYAMQFIQGQGLDAVLDALRRLRRPDAVAAREDKYPARACLGAAGEPVGQNQGSDDLAQAMLTGEYSRAAVATAPAAIAAPVAAARGSSPSAATHASVSTGVVLEPKARSDARYYRSVAQLGIQVAEALAHAHQQGILHRDIKPANLLLDTHGIVWITDFGLAKSEDAEGLTSQGDIVGTLGYMAPERFQGKADARSDVYSLALTLYEMLTLQPAYSATDKARLIDLVLHTSPPPPRALDPRIPRDLEIIVQKAMAKTPEDRYASGQQLADDLRRFLDDKPILARRPSPWARLAKWARRHRAVVTTALIGLAAALAVAGAALAWNWRQHTVRLAALRQSVERLVGSASQLLRQGRFSEASAEIRKAEGTLSTTEQASAELSFQVREARLELESAAHHEVNAGLRASAAALKLGKHREAAAAVRRAEDVLTASGLGRADARTAIEQARLDLEKAATGDIDQAIAESRLLLKEGKGQEALAAVRRAESILAAGGMAAKIALDALSQARRDAETLKLLDKARLARTRVVNGSFSYRLAEPDYMAAFAFFGLDLAAMEATEMAARIGASAIRSQLVAMLDEWALDVTRDKARRKELLNLASMADDDGWRRDFRALVVSGDRIGLIRAAALPEVLLQPPPTLVLLSTALFEAGGQPEAIQLLRRAQVLHPGDVWINHELGMLLGETSSPHETIAYASAALALRPGNHGLHNNLANALMQSGELAAAEAHFRRALELEKDYTDVYRNLAICLFRARRFAEALANFDEYVKRRPAHARGHLNRGEALVELDRHKEAVEAFAQALRLDAKGADAIVTVGANLGLGQCLLAENRLKEALQALEKAQKADDTLPPSLDTAHVHYHLGRVYVALGEPKRAIAAYEKALAVDPSAIASLVNLGNIYHDMGSPEDLARAERLFRKALVHRPTDYKTLNNLASALIRQNRFREAAELCEEAIKHNSEKDHLAYYHLAITRGALNDPTRAEAAYRQALTLAPSDPETLCNLGRLLQRKGKYAEAVGLLRRGHELGSKNPGWPYPSAEWLKEARRLEYLSGVFAGHLRGEPPPRDRFDRFGMAFFAAAHKGLYATAARLYGEAIAASPAGDALAASELYNGACFAALAAQGKGEEGKDLGKSERARLRAQALAWLRDSLKIEAERSEKAAPAERDRTRRRLAHWLVDPDLVSIRDLMPLLELPRTEREEFLAFWADVVSLQSRLNAP